MTFFLFFSVSHSISCSSPPPPPNLFYSLNCFRTISLFPSLVPLIFYVCSSLLCVPVCLSVFSYLPSVLPDLFTSTSFLSSWSANTRPNCSDLSVSLTQCPSSSVCLSLLLFLPSDLFHSPPSLSLLLSFPISLPRPRSLALSHPPSLSLSISLSLSFSYFLYLSLVLSYFLCLISLSLISLISLSLFLSILPFLSDLSPAQVISSFLFELSQSVLTALFTLFFKTLLRPTLMYQRRFV